VLDEEADIRLDVPQIGAGEEVIVEVGVVGPNADVVADLAPADQVLAELLVPPASAVVDWVNLAAFDAAELDLHVPARPDSLGGLPCIDVGEGPHVDARALLRDRIGDGVDQRQMRAHMAFRLRVEGGALLALAVEMIVVLTDRDVGSPWILSKLGQHVLGDDSDNLGVTLARLGLARVVLHVRKPLPVAEREVLRVDGSIPSGPTNKYKETNRWQ